MLKRAGANLEDEKLKAILNSQQLAEITLPEDAANALSGKLMNFDEAKINPELFNHGKATHLNGIDASLLDVIKGLEDEGVRKEIEGLPTSKKVLRLLEAQKAQEGKNAINALKGKEDLKEELERMRNQIKEVEEAKNKEKQLAIDEKENEITELMQESFYSSLPYGTGFDPKVNKLTAKNLIELEMKEKGLAIRRNGMSFELYNTKTPDIPYTENNLVVDHKSFVTKILATNKMLEVNKDDNKQGQQQQHQQKQFFQPNAGEKINYDQVRQVSALKQEMLNNSQ